MVRRWEGGEGGRGVDDSRKLRRLYIFWGDFCVSQFFYRVWNVSIGMNVLRPPST